MSASEMVSQLKTYIEQGSEASEIVSLKTYIPSKAAYFVASRWCLAENFHSEQGLEGKVTWTLITLPQISGDRWLFAADMEVSLKVGCLLGCWETAVHPMLETCACMKNGRKTMIMRRWYASTKLTTHNSALIQLKRSRARLFQQSISK